MVQSHPKIPPEIYAELSPSARIFFGDLIDDYEQRIDELNKKIAEGGKPVKPTPQNSSVPPSTVHPHGKPKPKPKKRKSGTGKKHGGQPGHRRNTRALLPTEECQAVVPLHPETCRKCAQLLTGSDPRPLRHQVFELPVIKPIVTEFQLHRLTCEGCGTKTCAQLPPGVPTGQCGPVLASFVALLLGHFRQSKRRAASFLSNLLNIPCSASWIVKIQKTVTGALDKPYQELQSELTKQPQLFIDESPTKQAMKKAWLWVAVAPLFAVFGIFLSRKRKALKSLVGDYSGIIINCDRAKMYFDGKQLQWCWSHLKRDIQKLIDSPDGQVKRLGHDLMRQERLLFELWHNYKDGKLSWTQFQTSIAPVRKEFNSLLVRGLYSGNKALYGLCNELWSHRSWLWTFTEIEGIEPTNNAAERALRPAVIYRKLSFGTQSDSGSRFIERIMTVCETCRIQKRSPFQYVVAVMKAHFAKLNPPSLLPKKDDNSSKKAA